MAVKMPGDGTSTPVQISNESIQDALKGPQLTPLPKPSYASNGTYGRVQACYVPGHEPPEPPQQYLSQGPSDDDLRRQAESNLGLQNTFDMEDNPFFMVPMAARAWGANESQVSVLNKVSTGFGSAISGTIKAQAKTGYKPF